LLKAGQPQKAAEILRRSIARQPTADAQALLGDALAQTGKTSEATNAWRTAIALDTSHRTAREAMAGAALAEGAAQAALDWLAPLETSPDLRASTAYLFQRAYTRLNNSDEAGRWQERAEALRTKESRNAAITNIVLTSPNSFWSRVIRAHEFASTGNRAQAQALVEQLVREAPDEPFVVDLAAAVREGKPLPSLERLPVDIK
jgi:tetratricopeptide (TPR) repeat protein